MKLIPLTQGQFAKVNDADYLVLEGFRWYAQYCHKGKRFYVRGVVNKEIMELGRMLLGLHKGDKRKADHINGDGLDNRRGNLRIVSNRENQMNQARHRAGHLPGTKRSGKKWGAKLKINGVCKWLGTWPTQLDAHRAYMRAVKTIG